MPILPPIAAVTGSSPITLPTAVSRTPATDPAAQERGVDFGKAVVNALDNLQASHSATDALAEKAATGDLKAVEDYMVMATETQLATKLTVAVRNRAVESFNEIMRMQI
jgi:flagellar hook-basal body complex protein FliE